MSSHVLMIARVVQPFGGVIQYVADVAEALLAADKRVTLAITDSGREAPCIQNVVERGLELERLLVSDRPEAFASHLDEIVERIEPDLVHLNDGSRLARAAIPLMRSLPSYIGRRVVTLHADILLLGEKRSRRGFPLVPWSRIARRRREVQRFLECFDLAISVSEVFATQIPLVLNLKSTKVTAIPNGVDLERFCPQRLDRGGDNAVVVAASGGLVRCKRFDLLISAAASIKHYVPCRVRIAGAGPEEQSLRRHALELGVQEDIEFMGRIDDMPGFLQEADIFAVCSTTETSCYSQLEAMASGLPSVCSRCGDLSIRVRDGVDGFLIPCSDPQSLAEKLLVLIQQPVLRRHMGISARERVEAAYSKQSYTGRTVQAFDEMRSTPMAGILA